MKSRRALQPIFYVYEHWRPDLNCCFYIGKGYGNRAGFMSKRSMHHKNIQSKLARQGLRVEIRIVREGMSEPEALQFERRLIAEYRQRGVMLVNLTDGGEGTAGLIRPPETRQKMAAAAKRRRPRTPEENRRHAETMRGRKQSPEVIAKRAEKLKGRIVSPETRAKLAAANTGKRASPELRRKLSEAHKGKKPPPLSAEARSRIAAARRAYWRARKQVPGQMELSL